MRLIVTADDFGLSEGINQGIIDCSRNGIVTRASLIANGPSFDHAVSLAKQHKELRIGVHLTLIEEKPVSNPERIRSIVRTHDANFYANYKQLIIRYFLNRVNPHEIYIEFEAQIEKILNAGLSINHVDSHQHLHMLPGIFSIVVTLAKKYGIRKIRFPCCRISRSNSVKETLVTLLGSINKSKLDGSFELTDYCFGLAESGNLHKNDLLRLISDGNCNTVEIIAHPGYADKSYRARYGYWMYKPEQEFAALTDQDVKNTVRSKGVELIF
jgi:hopanoid biosynthesis associated protein HpnK